MRKRWLLGVVFMVAAIALAAQDLPKVTVNIPFQFMAGTKSLPAGRYELVPNERGTEIMVRNLQGRGEVAIPCLTRLAPRPGNQPSLLFDKVDSVSHLAEMHLPGIDGFMLKSTPGPHSHVTVTSGK